MSEAIKIFNKSFIVTVFALIITLVGCKIKSKSISSQIDKTADGIILKFSSYNPSYFHFIQLGNLKSEAGLLGNLMLENNLDTGIYIYDREPVAKFFDEQQSAIKKFKLSENDSCDALMVRIKYTEFSVFDESKDVYNSNTLELDGEVLEYVIKTERYSKVKELVLINK